MSYEIRTDAHSPKNVRTEDYEFVTCFDTGAPGFLNSDWAIEVSRKVHQANADRGMGQCHHCGARMRYVAILEYTVNGDYIAIGETCLDNRFSLATEEFQKLRKEAALERGKQKIKKAIAAFVIDNPELAFMDMRNDIEIPEASQDNGFIASLIRQLNNNGSLTERQIVAGIRSIAQDAERAEKRAAAEAEQANAPEAAPVPVGRCEITGKVVGLKSNYTDWGTTYKMMVQLADGGKVWVSVPSAIDPERGDTVRLTCTIEASPDDETFGFGKRPSKASIEV